MKKVYVFYGDNDKKMVETIVKNIFKNDEIIYIPEFIFLDDSIRIIKQKLKKYINDVELTIEEVYLTCKRRDIDIEKLFEEVKSKSDKMLLLNNLLSKLYNNNNKKHYDNLKKKFNFNDFKLLFKEIKDVVFNDFVSTTYNKNLKKFILADLFLLNKDITTNIIEKINYNINTDDRLLLDNDLVKLDDKIKIFSLDLIRYSDVSKFYEKNKDYNEIMNYIVNMYYPLLKKNDIFTFQDYQEQSNMLQKNNDKEVKEILDKEYALDKFYVDLFNKSKFNYTSSGYNYIKLLIKPPANFKLNFENIFKLIHSNKDYPLIRINFGHSYDKLYRLYTENQTTKVNQFLCK